MKPILLALCALSVLALAAGSVNIESSGDLLLVSKRTFAQPTKVILGDGKQGLYIFAQPQSDGTMFSGMESFVLPANGPVSAGYGAGVGRIWFRHALIEKDGSATFPVMATDKIYFGAIDRSHLGGIRPDPKRLDLYLTTENGDIVACREGRCTPLTN